MCVNKLCECYDIQDAQTICAYRTKYHKSLLKINVESESWEVIRSGACDTKPLDACLTSVEDKEGTFVSSKY